MSVQQAIQSAVSNQVTSGVSAAFDKFFAAQRRAEEGLVRERLVPGERLLGYQIGQIRMPFWLRILPLMPDLLTRPKNFALAVTNQRLLILRMVRSGLKTTGARPVAAIPCMAASRRKSLSTKRSRAPKHFMVPISRKRSVTAMSWAFTIPTTQTSKDNITIHRCFGLLPTLVAVGSIS